MVVSVIKYSVTINDTEDGYEGMRAQIYLYDANNNQVGHIRFQDPGMLFPNDSQSGGKIIMHLPSAMFNSVLGILRNELPIALHFSAGHALLSTSTEPIGEAE